MEESIEINTNKDMFNIDIPSFSTEGAEILPPAQSVQQPTEIQTVASKSIVSFGTMGICIVIFLIIAFIAKKRKDNSDAYTTQEEGNIEPLSDEVAEENQTIKQTKKAYLNTPSSIHKCIKSFLENTKEN